jgi:hypothetical protein
MAQPFSTNELFLRSDRIAFGKIPPEVPARVEQLLILPDETGSKLYFGLSSLVSTSGLTGTLEAIYPNYAAFTFDNLNSRLGINVSSPQYALDISTTTGVRILGGPLIANASGLVSVPTAALFSTLPSYVFSPGTIPITALNSTGTSVLPGISVPTSALFSTLPTSIFAPSSIPLVALQSSGIIVASTFVGDGTYLSNIPLANINGTITGDFFRPNTIPLSTLASTGQIWIRNPQGSIFAPIISTGQFFTSSLVARDVSTVNLTTNRFIASSIYAQDFESQVFSAVNLSAINIKASSIQVLQMISSGRIYGDGQSITNLTPANLNNVIPADKFGYRLIAFDAINPYGNFLVEAGSATFRQAVPVYIQGTAYGSTFQGGYFRGDGGGLYNLPGISSATLYSTIQGLGTIGYVSSTQLASTVQGLGSSRYVSSTQLASTVQGLASAGFLSTTQLQSTVEGLGSSEYISSSQLLSTVAGLEEYISTFHDQPELNSTIKGLGTAGYVSTLSLYSTVAGLGTSQYISTGGLRSTVEGLASSRYISSSQLNSTIEGLATAGFVSSTQLASTVEGLGSSRYISSAQLLSTVAGLGSIFYVSSSQVASTVEGLATAGFISSTQLTSTIEGLATSGFISSTQLASTVEGLGSSRYISSAQLISTVAGLEFYVSSFIDPTEVGSTVIGLGTVGYVSTTQLTSTVEGLGSSRYISSAQLLSTVAGLEVYVSSFIDPTELTSTVVGLGTAGIVSTIGLTSTIQGLGTLGYVSTTQLASTVQGLGSSRYISSAQLISTVAGLEFYVSSFIDVTELTSTVIGLGTDGFVSTIGLTSTIQGLGTLGYVSTTQLISTVEGLEFYVSSFIDPTELTSTVIGLGTAGFVSTLGLEAKLVSTVEGLGTSGYVSTLNGGVFTLTPASPSNIVLSPLTNSIRKIANDGSEDDIWTQEKYPFLTVSFQTNFSTLNFQQVNLTRGVNAFYGLLFHPNGFVYVHINGGASPALGLYDSTANYGIQLTPTNVYWFVNDQIAYVYDQAPVSNLYSLQFVLRSLGDTILNLAYGGTSSPNQAQSSFLYFASPLPLALRSGLLSTVEGLGSAGYVSTLSLISTTQGLQESISSCIDTTELTSTVVGLGTVGYVSTASLLSTTQGLQESISSFIDPTELTSTVVGLGSLGIVSTIGLTSTIVGLGTLGYVSTASLVSTTQGLQEYISSFIDPAELTSTVIGLGSLGIVSTIGLTSTIQGLGTFGYVSTLSLVSTTSNVIYGYGTGLSTLSSAISGAPSYQGQLLYMNQTTPVGPYKQLSPYPIYSTLQSTITALPAGSDSNLLAAFQTDYSLPPFIPVGIWDLNLFADSDSASNVLFFYTLSTRAPDTSERFLFKSGTETITNIGVEQYINSMPVSYTPLPAASTLVLKLYGSNSGASPATLTAYFQNSYYSHVHTTFNAGQESGASGVSSLSTVVGLAFPSTVAGLGSSDYVSTLTLNAAISSLSTAYGFVGSLAVLPSTVSTFALQTSSLTASTITAITLSSFDLRVSSINGQLPGSGSLTSLPSTISTFSLLTSTLTASTITVNYISGLALWISSINGALPGSGSLTSLPSTISTFSVLTSSLTASTIQTINLSSLAIVTSSITANFVAASTGVISSFSTNIINFAGGFGYLTMPDIYPNTVYTSSVTASNLLVGWTSQMSPIQFFGFGTYTNSVISELSTGSATQELVMFRGSNASDRIRMQTTGSIVFEPGVSARLWPTVPSNVTPAMVINTSSNIGIQTASPTVPLDVAGAIRAVSLSTQQIATSSILGAPVFPTGATFASSVTFRGPSTFFLGSLSTSFLTAGTSQVYFPGPVGIGVTNPAFLLDVAGTGEFSTILTSSLTSWMTISTTQLGTSSVVANTSMTIIASSFQMGASTFTGKWNDAQYYVLQTI